MHNGRLTVLGCEGSYPGPHSAGSGYLVTSEQSAIWLDAGTGTFERLRSVCDPRSLNAIVVSHEHRDHCGDLSRFAAWAAREQAAPIPVLGPPGLIDAGALGERQALRFIEVEPACCFDLNDLRLSFVATDHPPPTLAVRIQAIGGGAPALAYSADTGPAWSVDELGDDIGVFLCEATYTAELEPVFAHLGHLSGRQAGEMAARAEVRQLVLTHAWRHTDPETLRAEASGSFSGPIHQASPGMMIQW
ncbi:MAG: MBL fold metallo-hydrolase [Acidimicrobiales bacterium]